MQISDLNSNLIQALGGKQASQTKAEDKNSEFADVLRDTVQGVDEFMGADEYPETVVAEYHREVADVGAKKIELSDNRTSEPKKHQKNTEVNKRDSVSTDKVGESKNNSSSEIQNKVDNTTEKAAETSSVEAEAPEGAVIEENMVVEGVNPEILMVLPDGIFEVDVAQPEGIIVQEPIIGQEVIETEDDITPEVMVVNPQIDGEQVQNPVSVEVNAEDVVAVPVEIVVDEVKSKNIYNNAMSKDKNVDIPLTAELSVPAEEVIVDNELTQQKAKIAELLPEDSKVKMEVNIKNDNITSFNENAPLATVIENVEPENSEILDASSQVSVEEAQVFEAANIEPEFAVANVVEEIKVVDFVAEKNSSLTDITNSTVSSFVTGENISQTSGTNVTNSVNDNFKDIYNKGLTRDIAEQIKVNITQSAIKGVDKVEIKLNPADLGQLEIKMQIGKDGRLQAHIIASNAETLDLLQKDLSNLKDAFNNAGYQTDDGSFSFSYRGEEQNNNNEREQLRNFIGEVIAQDIAEELAANNDYVSVDGVNIRV